MKKLLKTLLLMLVPITLLSSVLIIPTYADNGSTFTGQCHQLLGLTSWDCGVNISNETTLKAGIWQIAANVSTDLTIIAAYLILGYVIYGGYLYMFSGGDPTKAANGKKTLTHAFIGLAIVMGANLIMGTIRILLFQNGQMGNSLEVNALVQNLINWFIGMAGVVSVIFLVYGGVLYMTSSGDPSKTAKAKNVIMYSLIGLAIVALSLTISAFISNIIRDSVNQ